MSDPWEDEGYAGEDDWEAGESVEAALEDDLGLEELEEGEPESEPESEPEDDG